MYHFLQVRTSFHSLQGFQCCNQGLLCPVSHLDTESLFSVSSEANPALPRWVQTPLCELRRGIMHRRASVHLSGHLSSTALDHSASGPVQDTCPHPCSPPLHLPPDGPNYTSTWFGQIKGHNSCTVRLTPGQRWKNKKLCEPFTEPQNSPTYKLAHCVIPRGDTYEARSLIICPKDQMSQSLLRMRAHCPF